MLNLFLKFAANFFSKVSVLCLLRENQKTNGMY